MTVLKVAKAEQKTAGGLFLTEASKDKFGWNCAEVEQKTAGGLFLTETSKDKPSIGTMAVGMSDRSHPSDTRADMKGRGHLAQSIEYIISLNQATKVFGSHFWMLEWLHLWVFTT